MVEAAEIPQRRIAALPDALARPVRVRTGFVNDGEEGRIERGLLSDFLGVRVQFTQNGMAIAARGRNDEHQRLHAPALARHEDVIEFPARRAMELVVNHDRGVEAVLAVRFRGNGATETPDIPMDDSILRL